MLFKMSSRCLLPSLRCAILLFSSAVLTAAVEPVKRPFLATYCADCHGPEKQKGDFRVDHLKWPITTAAQAEDWRLVADKVGAGEMPPKKDKAVRQPLAKESIELLETINAELNRVALALKSGTEGQETFRRMNRVQYQNTLRDLLGIRGDASATLPEDAVAMDFDRIGSALSLSAEQINLYMAAAEWALLRALPPTIAKPQAVKLTGTLDMMRRNFEKKPPVDELRTDILVPPEGGLVLFGKNESKCKGINATAGGRYKILVTVAAYQSPGHVVYGQLRVGGTPVGHLEAQPDKPVTAEFDVWLERGATLSVVPLLDHPPRPFRNNWIGYTGAGLWVKSIEMEGPFYDEWPPRGQKVMFGDLAMTQKNGKGSGLGFFAKAPEGKDGKNLDWLSPVSTSPAADAQRLMSEFLPKAFRRPVQAEEVARFTKLATDAMAEKKPASFYQAMVFAYTAALCSPDFLFFKERKGPLDDYAIASRLSYFLTSSMPDDALFATAKVGKLRDPAERIAQANRLLDSPAADRFINDFTGQWLQLRDIENTTPDAKLYPEFDRVLQDAMVRETQMFFAEILLRNRSVLEFVSSDWTFLNGRLAAHYGIPGVSGMEMKVTKLPAGSQRGGVLTQASILKVTANGTETSPVKRGKWILERILSRPPPPPPPNVPAIQSDARGASSIREVFAKHRADASCAGCHAKLDPHGFALENFDVTGEFRTKCRTMSKTATKVPGREYKLGAAVQSEDELPDGRKFASCDEYKKLLITEQEQITRSLTQKVMIYALGRGLTFADRPTVDAIVADVTKNHHGFRTLVLDVIRSASFATK